MLQEKLKALSDKSKEAIPKEILKKLGKGVEELQNTHLEDNIIKIGDKLPKFNLIDASGNTYSNDDFKGKKLVLNFFRGSW